MKIHLLFAATLGLVSLLYAAGFQYDLFWHWWWYDITLHTLAGVAIGVGVFRIGYLYNVPHVMVIAVVAALSIGVAWELLEHYLGLPRSLFLNYVVDTTKDLVMDAAGAIIGVSVARAL